MEKEKGRNETPVVELILLGFGEDLELQPLLFLVFLVIYLVTMGGNILIVVLVVTDRHLHTPMYYFLGNLGCLEICYTSTLLPRLLASLLTGDRTISLQGCIAQFSFFLVLSNTECLLLTSMSYDRYLAICHPLHYAALMNGRVCCQIVVGCWMSSLLLPAILNIFIFQLTFCGSKEIDHFFCEFIPMLNPSCDETQTLQLITFAFCTIFTIGPLLFTLTSYICIIITILKIPSNTGKQKAFSTCSSHLIVLAVLYATVIIVYLVPTANTPYVLSKIFSVCYTVLTSLLNPIIYCLRNKEVKESLRKLVLKFDSFKTRIRI